MLRASWPCEASTSSIKEGGETMQPKNTAVAISTSARS